MQQSKSSKNRSALVLARTKCGYVHLRLTSKGDGMASRQKTELKSGSRLNNVLKNQVAWDFFYVILVLVGSF
jgi:hypothetical protein